MQLQEYIGRLSASKVYGWGVLPSLSPSPCSFYFDPPEHKVAKVLNT